MNTTDAKIYLTEVLPKLKSFLISNSLIKPIEFGSAPFKKPLPSISIGNVYLALARLPKEEIQQSSIKNDIQTLLKNWQVAVEEKGTKELTSKIRQWTEILEEWREETPNNTKIFSYEIRIRTIIELLYINFGTAAINTQLVLLDEILKILTIESDFVWEKELSQNFSQNEYWFLYRKIS